MTWERLWPGRSGAALEAACSFASPFVSVVAVAVLAHTERVEWNSYHSRRSAPSTAAPATGRPDAASIARTARSASPSPKIAQAGRTQSASAAASSAAALRGIGGECFAGLFVRAGFAAQPV